MVGILRQSLTDEGIALLYKKLFGFIAFLFALLALFFETSVCAQQSPAPREPTPADIASWRWINNAQLTPDGKWLAYVLAPLPSPNEGEAVAVLRSTYDSIEQRYQLGSVLSGAGNLKMAPSGRWVAFQAFKSALRLEGPNRKDKLSHTCVSLVEVASGKARDFPEVHDFLFVKGRSEYLLLDGYLTNANESWRSLTVTELATGRDLVQEEAAEYSLNKSGSKLAWSSRQGLKVCDLASGSTRVIEGTSDTFTKLTWSDRGNALAALRDDPVVGRTIVTFRNLNSTKPEKEVFAPSTLSEFPKGYEISADNPTKADFWSPDIPTLLWRVDENGLFFGIRPTQQSAPPVSSETAPNLVLWHWKDQRLPAAKRRTAAQPTTDLCFVSLQGRRFLRLGDETLRRVQPQQKGQYVLGFDQSKYQWYEIPNGVRASEPRDYYLVELQSGKRNLVAKGLQVIKNRQLSVQPQLSPDGSAFLYQNNEGDYISYQVSDGRQLNLTTKLPTKFYYDENDPKTRRQPRIGGGAGDVLKGYAQDGAFVLISDYYDIWALPLKGGSALNLSVDGRAKGITYKLFTDISEWDLGKQYDEPIYFTFHDPTTGKNGLARRLGRTNIQILNSALANVRYLKASAGDTYVCQFGSSVESGNYYLLGRDWRIATRLTDSNPHERELMWAPESKYLTYTTAHGDHLTAALYLPVGYIPGRSYPTIVPYVYERNASAFSERCPDCSIDRWQRRGYAVLFLDIQPRLNDASQAAVEGAAAAIEAAVATGVVDRSRIGLIGQSQGAFEVYSIICNSNLIKAAVAEAGVSNQISRYGSVRFGQPASIGVEYDQGFLTGPWWEQWDAFVRNSPLFSAKKINTPLLIVHGDQDPAVPFDQSVEMFNNLRRMGDKPVVLLQYVGEDHSLRKEENIKDAEKRINQFFDHFLKSEPAPAWWANGVSYYQGQAPKPNAGPERPD